MIQECCGRHKLKSFGHYQKDPGLCMMDKGYSNGRCNTEASGLKVQGELLLIFIFFFSCIGKTKARNKA